jgi:alpha-tubulin suppressor-like RCC1 family protein
MKPGSRWKLVLAGCLVVLLLGLIPLFVRSKASSLTNVFIAPVRERVVTPMMVGNWDRIIILAPDGTLWGWGASVSGELGIIPRDNQNCGVRQISSARDWTEVATSSSATLALKKDGTLWAWGADKFAAKSADAAKPAQVGSATHWRHVAAGASHYVVQKTDGTLWTWGPNNEGQLGDGTMAQSMDPIQIGSRPWKTFAVGAFHGAAIAPDGSLWSWGRHAAGGGTKLAQVGDETNWVSVFCGEYHTLAQKSDGSWWIWGENATFMQPNAVTTPVKISGIHSWATVAGGNCHSVALGKDGAVWAFGYNNQGVLGDGTTTTRQNPVRVGTETNWVAVAATGNTSAAMASDGSVFIWGVCNHVPSPIRSDANVLRIVGRLVEKLAGRSPSSGTARVYSTSSTPVNLMRFKPLDSGVRDKTGVHTNGAPNQTSGEH